jgi:hypothetical protein
LKFTVYVSGCYSCADRSSREGAEDGLQVLGPVGIEPTTPCLKASSGRHRDHGRLPLRRAPGHRVDHHRHRNRTVVTSRPQDDRCVAQLPTGTSRSRFTDVQLSVP